MGQEENQVYLMLGRIEAKLDSYMSKHEDLNQEVLKLKAEVEAMKQSRQVSSTIWNFTKGAFLTIGFVLGSIADNILHYISTGQF